MSIQSEMDTFYQVKLQNQLIAGNGPETPTIEIKPSAASRLVFRTEPNGLAVEQYKLLRRKLCVLRPAGGVTLVTSPSPGDGKTLTCANIAHCLAESGRRTLLVDLDFRAPSVSRTLELPTAEFDVTDVLSGRCATPQALRRISSDPLFALTITSSLDSPARQFSSPLFKPWLKEMRDQFEWVLLDMAPVIPISDVGEVLSLVDGALLVVRSGKTAKSLIGPSIEILGSKLWGAIFNDSTIHGGAYYGSYGYGKR